VCVLRARNPSVPLEWIIPIFTFGCSAGATKLQAILERPFAIDLRCSVTPNATRWPYEVNETHRNRIRICNPFGRFVCVGVGLGLPWGARVSRYCAAASDSGSPHTSSMACGIIIFLCGWRQSIQAVGPRALLLASFLAHQWYREHQIWFLGPGWRIKL
jgi:hypothetical protein